MITVEKEEIMPCLNETCKDLAASKIFPFDARKSDRIDETCTHYVLDANANLSLELLCALALQIRLVGRDFLEDLSRGVYPEKGSDAYAGFKELRLELFKSINVMDVDMDPLSSHYLRLLGASVSPKSEENHKNIILSDQVDVLLRAIEKGDLDHLDLLVPKSAGSIVVSDSPISLERVRIENSGKHISETPSTENITKRERINRGGVVLEESDVKMVSTFVDLYRPARSGYTCASSAVPNNCKRFKKSAPSDRKAAECIGFADMQPYKGVMETGGVNQSKTESWLVADIARPKTNIAKPAQSTEAGVPKFRSSFFSEGLQFE